MTKPRRHDAGFGSGKSQSSPSSLSSIPIEWLDPDCWRLPSGKALAEFALQAGFLAPLMLGMPRTKRPAAKVAPAGQQGLETEETKVAAPQPVGEGRKLARESSRVSKRV